MQSASFSAMDIRVGLSSWGSLVNIGSLDAVHLSIVIPSHAYWKLCYVHMVDLTLSLMK